MTTTPLSPKLIKGALVELSQRFISVVPNVILFQYNPETMTRKLEPWQDGGSEGGQSGASQESIDAQPDNPGETIDLTLEFDAADALEHPESHPVAVISGVADRLAALELMLYPEVKASATELLGSAAASLGGAALASAGGAVGGAAGVAASAAILNSEKELREAMDVPRGKVPTVFFVWGPGRIVPVRLTSFSVEEQAYSPTLYPIRAKVTVSMKIVAPPNLPCKKKPAPSMSIAAYNLYVRQKRGMAAANIANNVESIIGMLPF